MKLNVPFISGGEGALSGSASTEMVLRYYGIDFTHKEIQQVLSESHGGTDMAQIGRVFLRYGFTTTLVTQHPRLFSAQDAAFSQEEIHKKIDERIEFVTGGKHDRITLCNACAYMREGGHVQVQVPSFSLVKEDLDHGRPVIAYFSTSFNAGGRSNKNYHPVVIIAYRGKYIFIHDPIRKSRKILVEWFFGGIYAGGHEVLDHGSLLLIRKNQ